MKLLDLRSTETNLPETFIGYEATSILEKLGKISSLGIVFQSEGIVCVACLHKFCLK